MQGSSGFKGLIGAAALVTAGASQASIVVLDFEGVNASYPSGFAQILDFYNGGTSSDGTSGTNYGVKFSSNALAICLNTPGTTCSNTSRGGLAPGSDKGALFFLSGAETVLDYSAGFTTGFSFFYTKPNDFVGEVRVYDALGGMGNLLGTIALPSTPSACDFSLYNAGYCPFVAAGVAFSGTAKSIVFAGVANFVVFDDITFGSSRPGGGGGVVPEPATWAMFITGFGLVGGLLRRRRASGRVTFA
ncbi:MAG: PEPxxWA-CTERM sorting domain-containing protein [Sphingomonadaceae bacterium]